MGSVVSLSALIRVLAAGAAEHGEAPSLADPLISHWLWTWIIFGVVFLILWRFAFRPIREQLEARENRIRETVEKADQVKNEAVALLDKHREMMDRAKADAQEVINEGAGDPRAGPQGDRPPQEEGDRRDPPGDRGVDTPRGLEGPGTVHHRRRPPAPHRRRHRRDR
jgi:hypothetical protein